MAVGALYLSLNHPSSPVYYLLALHQKQRSLHQLRNDIASLNGASNNHILVSMLMLCLFDVGSSQPLILPFTHRPQITDNCQTSWSTHVSAAASLITMKGAEPSDPRLVSFVSKFFATRDVMGRSACGKRAKFRETAWGNPQEVRSAVETGYPSNLLNKCR